MGKLDQEEKKIRIEEVLNQQDGTARDKKYNEYVEERTPKHSWLLNLLKAYLIGGLICVLGQALNNWFQKGMDMGDKTAGWYTIVVLILLSVLLTGLTWYPKLAKFGGAGCVVPITGFANSVASAAIEYQKEGQVFGIGCKIFTIAGPVILYGIFSSWVLGLIYWAGTLFGWF